MAWGAWTSCLNINQLKQYKSNARNRIEACPNLDLVHSPGWDTFRALEWGQFNSSHYIPFTGWYNVVFLPKISFKTSDLKHFERGENGENGWKWWKWVKMVKMGENGDYGWTWLNCVKMCWNGKNGRHNIFCYPKISFNRPDLKHFWNGSKWWKWVKMV